MEVEVDALAFLFILDPHALEVVALRVVQHAESVPLIVEPLALVNVAAFVRHDAHTMTRAVLPLTVEVVAVLIVEDSAAVLLVVAPLPRVLLAQLALAHHPERPHPIALALGPGAHVAAAVGHLMRAFAFPGIVLPLTEVLARATVASIAWKLLGEVDGPPGAFLVGHGVHLRAGQPRSKRRLLAL